MRTLRETFSALFVGTLFACISPLHAAPWTITFSGQMSSVSTRAVDSEHLVFTWDPSDITAGTFEIPGVPGTIGRFARGPLLSAEWTGLITGAGAGGTLDALDQGILGRSVTLESGGAVANLGSLFPLQPDIWTNPRPFTGSIEIVRDGFGRGGLFGGVPDGSWGIWFLRPQLIQTATVTISPIPEPPAVALIGSALLGLFVMSRWSGRRPSPRP
jgi:hypothetical protein